METRSNTREDHYVNDTIERPHHKPGSMIRAADSIHRFELCGMGFTAALFGKPYNWAIAQHSDPQLGPEYCERFGRVCEDFQAGDVFFMNTTESTTREIARTEFTGSIKMGAYAMRTAPHYPADFMRMQPGDLLPQTQSGCLAWVAARHTVAIGAHTGRWNFFDRHELLYNEPAEGRRHFSIVYAILDALGVKSKDDLAEVEVKALWAIPPAEFPHDLDDGVYGEVNEKLHAHLSKYGIAGCFTQRGRIFLPDLPQILKHQLMMRGVPEKNINLDHAYLPSRDRVYMDGRKGAARNLATLKRRY